MTHHAAHFGELRASRSRDITFAKQERCVSDAFVSVMNTLGDDTATIGAPERCKGPLPGMLA